MSLGFPSRFLRKLDIYQQIRAGQGISKYKRLWKYEGAFLQTAYGKRHQHLSNFVSRTNFKRWIEETKSFESTKDEGELNHIIASLFWRGYIDVTERVNDKKTNNVAIQQRGLRLLDGKSRAYKSKEFGDEKSLDYRPTLEGLLVGELLSEINNKNCFLKYMNRYRYSLVIDTLWLAIFWVLAKLFIPHQIINNFGELIAGILPSFLPYWLALPLFIIAGWPLINLAGREIYKYIENND